MCFHFSSKDGLCCISARVCPSSILPTPSSALRRLQTIVMLLVCVTPDHSVSCNRWGQQAFACSEWVCLQYSSAGPREDAGLKNSPPTNNQACTDRRNENLDPQTTPLVRAPGFPLQLFAMPKLSTDMWKREVIHYDTPRKMKVATLLEFK